MKSNVAIDIETSILPDFTEALLSRSRRRTLLRLLASYDQPQAAADLATELALREHDMTVDATPWEEIKRNYLRLHHIHLPKLGDADLITYDEERKMAALTARGEQLILEFEHIDDGLAEFTPEG